MDISDEDMAKLVLGYLRSEKCKGAVEPFLQSSRHLKDLQGSIRQSKHFITHLHGYSLKEILREFAKLYTIIIEHMEESTYSNEFTNRDMPSKLLHLLENAKRNQCSTPSMSPRSRSSTPIKQVVNRPKRRMSHNLSVIEEISPRTQCDVDATPLHELPGHMDTDCAEGGSGRTYTGRGDESDNTDNAEDKDDEEGSITQVLAETMLENKELQKKLAENINSVIKKPLGGDTTSENVVSNELDLAIKAIVDKTEHDPVFEKLLSNIIRLNESESGPDEQDNSVKDTDPNEKSITESTKQCSKESTDPVGSTAKAQTITIDGTKVDAAPKQNLTINANTGEVILYDGTLENYMKEPSNSIPSATSANPPNTSNLVANTGLLMVQPPVVPQSQSYFVWNGSQIVNVSVPQYNVNNLSEQDILTMPTVIVCDQNRQDGTAVATRPPEEYPTKRLRKIAPKEPLPEQCSARPRKKKKSSKKPSQRSTKPQNIQTIQIKILTAEEQERFKIEPDVRDGDIVKDLVQIKEEVNIDINDHRIDDFDGNDKKTNILEPTLNTDIAGCVSTDKPVSAENYKEKTPKQATPKVRSTSNTRRVGISTPKSGSHVRALDFNLSTPKHRIVTKREPTSSPKRKSPSMKSDQGKVSKSLFGSPSKTQKQPAEKKKPQGVGRSWDSDLRALTTANTVQFSPPKKKKPPPRRKSHKKEDPSKTDQSAEKGEGNPKCSNIDGNPEVQIEKTTEPEEKKLFECIQISVQSEAEEAGVNEDPDLMPFTLVNCNRGPRINRKCNIDGNLKKEVKVTKVKEVKNLEICNNKMVLSPSKLNANKRTLVENKSEDNKRRSSETKIQDSVEERKVPLTPSIFRANSSEENEILTLNFEKNLTPENIRSITCDNPVSKANRNLIPFLETPIKRDFLAIPKTPTILSPINTKDTPLTKIFKEHLEGVDLTSIQTPKFPITPNLTITPLNNEAYENRPTDYSTSSSYYQPSDTEQNKSLEQLIEDSKKENDKRVVKDTKNMPSVKSTDNITNGKNNPSTQKQQYIKTAENPKITESSTVRTSVVNKLTNFNRNVIGKKNLSLVSQTDPLSFEDTDSENDNLSGAENLNEYMVDVGSDRTSLESTSSEDSATLWGLKNNKNVTVIQNNSAKHRQSRYPLRSRNKDAKTTDDGKNIDERKTNHDDKKIDEKQKGNEEDKIDEKQMIDEEKIDVNERHENNLTENEMEVNDDKQKTDEKPLASDVSNANTINRTTNTDNVKNRKDYSNKQQMLLMELEMKRQRTIAKMKQPENVTKKRTATKHPNPTNQQSTPKEPNTTNQQSVAEEPNTTNQQSAPKQPNTTNQESAPKQPDTANQQSAPKQPNIANQESAPKQPNITNQESAPKQPNTANQQSVPKQPNTPSKEVAPKQSNITNQESAAPKQNKGGIKRKQLPKKQEAKPSVKKEAKKRAPAVKKDEQLDLNIDNSDWISPINLVEAHLENSTSCNAKEIKSSESSQDCCLVRDLKERGIHLVPNKKTSSLDAPDDNSSTELLNIANNSNNNGSRENVTNSRVLPLKKRDSNKSFEIRGKSEEASLDKIQPTDEKNRLSTLQEDLNLTDSFTEEMMPQFDFLTKLDLDDHIIYNPNEASTKSLKDYDFASLNKTYTADVFVEELNKEIKRPMHVSPMDFILNIDPESAEKVSDSDKVKIINVVTLEKFNPLRALYTELVPDVKNNFSTKSPLENLYEETTRKTTERPKTSRRRKSMEGNKKPQSFTKKSGRSVSIDEQKIRAKAQKAENQIDLMDYAIVGDETAVPNEQAAKRKAEEEIGVEKNKCPKLCENLLSGLNVDHFLSQIHKQ